MKSNVENTNLEDSTHWRYIQKISKELAKSEDYEISNYDFMNIHCYSCIGEDLQGKNVDYSVPNDYSCWVDNNQYDLFEIPAVLNKRNSLEGDFLFIGHDTTFDYWIFGDCSYAITDSEFFTDKMYYSPKGKYEIASGATSNYYSIIKTVSGDSCNFGYLQGKEYDKNFDSLGARKKSYDTSSSKIIGNAVYNSYDSTALEGGKAVKKYKIKYKNKKY